VAGARATPAISVGGIVAALGGAVAIGGSLLEMAKVSIGLENFTKVALSSTYFDTDRGKVVAAIGAAVVIVALATMVRPISRLIAPIVVAAGGLAILGFSIYDRVDLDSSTDAVRHRLTVNNPLSGLVHVDIGPGLYVVMAGGALATIGAVLAARER
jgi:hypothetical protein